MDTAATHDAIRAALELGHWKEGRMLAKRFLRQRPDFIPVLNNLRQIDYMEGQYEQAIATAKRVLSLDLDNFQALGNLARYLLLSGQPMAAQEVADRLKAVQSSLEDIWLKKMETFTFLGDDEAVLAAFQGAEAAGLLEANIAQPQFYHFAAVAAMRLGNEMQAKNYWRQACKVDRNFTLAAENLADLDQPVGSRNAPWPFPLQQWVSQKALTDMVRDWERGLRSNRDEAMKRAARRYLKNHAELIPLLPILLERGDQVAREFVLNLAETAETPEMLAMLRDFALSQHGPDTLRFRAANLAMRGGVLPSGEITLWLRGAWEETMLIGFEITDEPQAKYAPEWGDNPLKTLGNRLLGRGKKLAKKG